MNDTNHRELTRSFTDIVNSIVQFDHSEKMLYPLKFSQLSFDKKCMVLEILSRCDSIEVPNMIEDLLLFNERIKESKDELNFNTPIELSPQDIEEIKRVSKEEEQKESGIEQLNKLTGLKKVKDQIEQLVAFISISKMRQELGLKTKPHTLHMAFTGNPGTGKTTVARILGLIFKEIGILDKGHVVEIDRSNVVSMYQGEIEKNIKEYTDEAENGVLFIDEVYSFFDSSKEDQGKQGMNTLLKILEDRGHKFICIIAGYTNEVQQLLGSNPGLASRFPIHLDFEDYTSDELIEIMTKMFESQDYRAKEEYDKLFSEAVENERIKENFSNARFARNIVEASIRKQATRLYKIPDKDTINPEMLKTIEAEDF